MTELSGQTLQGSFLGIKATFKDVDGALVVPTAVSWTLKDGDGSIVNSREDVSVTPASTVYIALNGDDTELPSGVYSKTRYIIISATYNDATYGNGLTMEQQASFLIEAEK